MNISIKTSDAKINIQASRHVVEEKLAPIGRLLGGDEAQALLEVDLESAPAEGRSAEPVRLAATLSFGGHVLHAEEVKPTPESASDRVRNTLEAEIRRVRGKEKSVWKRGAGRVKQMMRFGR